MNNSDAYSNMMMADEDADIWQQIENINFMTQITNQD